MNNVHTLSAAGRATLAEMTAYHAERLADFERRNRTRDKMPRLQLARLMTDLASGRFHGEDRESIQEYARAAGIQQPDPTRPLIPFSALRDLSASSAANGGYLVATETAETVNMLRQWSITQQAGITMEIGLQGNQVVPVETAKATATFLTNEASAITPSTPTLAQISLTPKTAGTLVNFSRPFALQANAEGFVQSTLLRAIGSTIDQAVLNGSGANGQPTGLLNTSGIGTQSGTSLAHAGVVAMKAAVAGGNADDQRIAFIGTTGVRQLLETRERATGSGFIWDRDMVASRPAFVTTDMPSATLVCADWGELYVGVWGSGFQLEVNPFDASGFKVGTISARILVSMDVAVRHKAAFTVATSIT